jgi:hypothetical protein
MSDRTPATRAPTQDERERVAAELCEHFASGHLELEELELRLAALDRAETLVELDGLVRGLPALPAVSPSVSAPPSARGWALAVMGGSSRRGLWEPPRRLNALALMGGVELDFREARLPAGETWVTAVAIMGGIEIIVPPGLPVSVRGLGLLGAVDEYEHSVEEAGPDTPRLVVTALACMGSVEVKARARRSAENIASKRSGMEG